MPVYLVMTILAVAFTYLAQKHRVPLKISFDKEKMSRNNAFKFLFFAFISTLPYIVVMGFRYGVGTDYFFTYEPLIQGMMEGAYLDEMNVEPAFFYLCRFLASMGFGITYLMLICAIITFGLLFIAVYQQSEIPWLSIFLFVGARFFFIGTNAVRQILAMMIIVYAFKYIRQRKFWIYVIFIIIAMLFHTSVIVMIILYPLRYLKLNPFVAAGALALSWFLKEPLMAFMQFIVSKTPYAWYLESVFASAPPTYMDKFWAFLPLFAIGSFYYIKGSFNKNVMFNVYFASIFVVLGICLHRNIIPLTERVSWMFEIALIFLIPMLLKAEKNKFLRILFGIIMIAPLVYFTYYEIFLHGYHEAQLYRFVFFPEIAFIL